MKITRFRPAPSQIEKRPGLWLVVALFAASSALFAEHRPPELIYADLLFKQQEYAKAATQYRRFVDQNPSSDSVQQGWFRLGESLREDGQLKAASKAFENLVNKFSEGPQVGDASFRLGIMKFKAGDFSSAVVDFELASRQASSENGKYKALYYNARSLQKINKTDLALALYGRLIRTNPGPDTLYYQEKSILETARILSAKGDNEAAHQKFQTLIDNSTIPTIKEEAVVRSGLAAVASGEIEKGEAILRGSKQFRKDSKWHALAEVGAIFVAYAREEYDRVVAIYSSGTIITSAGEYRPKVLLMVADSFREEGDRKAADRLYSLVESRYPAADAGVEAGYRRLVILYKGNSGTLPTAVERYARNIRTRTPASPSIDKAYLMLAEWHFTQAERGVSKRDLSFAKNQYRSAAAVYQKIRLNQINPLLVPTLLYHQSWANLEAGNTAAGAETVTKLFGEFPEDLNVPSALAKRGETYLQKEDFISALVDFETITTLYPQSELVEVALERRGRIFAHQRDLIGMVTNYEALLAKFPDTPGKAEAHFWIGDGYFQQDLFAEAIPHLEKARILDRESYSNRAGIRSILSHHSLNQVPQMTRAARIYIQAGRDAGVLSARQKKDKPLQIPNYVLVHLAEELAKKKDYADSDFFLRRAISFDTPTDTEAKVWKQWGDLKMALKEYPEAIEAYDHLLAQTTNRNERGHAYVKRGWAQLALKQYTKSKTSAQECIRIVKQGRMNANARLLIGDIAAAQGDEETAAQEYYLVSQIFDDPKITPRAIEKAIKIHQKLGNRDDVASLQQDLQDRITRDKRKRLGGDF